MVIREGRGSVSLLQRALGIGYGRGARLIDFMAEDGIVGEYNGSQAREVLMTLEQWTAACGESPPPADAPPRKLRIQPHAEELSEDDDDELDDDAADEDDTDGDEAEGDDESSAEDDEYEEEEEEEAYDDDEDDDEEPEDDESADDDGEWEDDDASAEQ